MVIDGVGDRTSALQLKNVQNGRYHRVFNYYNEGNRLELLNETTIIWPGNTKTAPVGRPKCGFDNELCPTATNTQRKLKIFSKASYFYLFDSQRLYRVPLRLETLSTFGRPR